MKRVRQSIAPTLTDYTPMVPKEIWDIIFGYSRTLSNRIDLFTYEYGEAIFSFSCVNKHCNRLVTSAIPMLFEKESVYEILHTMAKFPVRCYYTTVLHINGNNRDKSTKTIIRSPEQTKCLIQIQLTLICQRVINELIRNPITFRCSDEVETFRIIQVVMKPGDKGDFIDYCVSLFDHTTVYELIAYIKNTISVFLSIPRATRPGAYLFDLATFPVSLEYKHRYTTEAEHMLTISHVLFPHKYIFDL